MNRLMIYTLGEYKKFISPFIKKMGFECIYKQTCSEYCIECFRKYNFFTAVIRCGWRILSCNPINGYLKIKGLEKDKNLYNKKC